MFKYLHGTILKSTRRRGIDLIGIDNYNVIQSAKLVSNCGVLLVYEILFFVFENELIWTVRL